MSQQIIDLNANIDGANGISATQIGRFREVLGIDTSIEELYGNSTNPDLTLTSLDAAITTIDNALNDRALAQDLTNHINSNSAHESTHLIHDGSPLSDEINEINRKVNWSKAIMGITFPEGSVGGGSATPLIPGSRITPTFTGDGSITGNWSVTGNIVASDNIKIGTAAIATTTITDAGTITNKLSIAENADATVTTLIDDDGISTNNLSATNGISTNILSATTELTVPVDDSSAGADGRIRVNSDRDALEFYRNGEWRSQSPLRIVNPSTTYTVASSDMGKVIDPASGTLNITINSITVPVGSVFNIYRREEAVEIYAGSGVELMCPGEGNKSSFHIANTWTEISLRYLDANKWAVMGDVE